MNLRPFGLIALLSLACSSQPSNDRPVPVAGDAADVTAVRTSGSAGAYTFSVTIRSPDTGCDAYADWFEVVAGEQLVYRRILAHSHVDEQPFERSGGPVAITADQEVIVRAHFSTTKYGGRAFRGSVAGGFEATELASDFAATLDQQPPLPDGCAF